MPSFRSINVSNHISSFRSIYTLPAQPSKIFFNFTFQLPHHAAAANQWWQLASLRLPSYRPLAHAKNPFQLGHTDQPVIEFIFRVHLHPSISKSCFPCPIPRLFAAVSAKQRPFQGKPLPPSTLSADKAYPAACSPRQWCFV